MRAKHIMHFIFILIFAFINSFIFIGCKKYITVSPPVASINEDNVYAGDNTAIAVVTSIYTKMSKAGIFTGTGSISVLAGLSADELVFFSGTSSSGLLSLNDYYTNRLKVDPLAPSGSECWSPLYNNIFVCNSAIDGLTKSTTLTPIIKQQLIGEAKFLRAFYYFYLVNLFGDVPLVLLTDYSTNRLLPRKLKSDVYLQIVDDLKSAQEMLSPDYLDGNLKKYSSASERLRPTKWAATALLARVYLYLSDWANAEVQSTMVINNSLLFSLQDLNKVFLKNSNEAIWQLQPVNSGWNTEDAKMFILPSNGPGNNNPVYLSNFLLSSFEAGDGRRVNWVGNITTGAKSYSFPSKYKSATLNNLVTEYLMVLRLAEQFLIRAEARAQQNNLSGAQSDINLIRKRAGLPDFLTNDRIALITAIFHERQIELFSEFGQRWLDIKRAGIIDDIMSNVTPLKANNAPWQSYQQYYPLPIDDTERDPSLEQNLGY